MEKRLVNCGQLLLSIFVFIYFTLTHPAEGIVTVDQMFPFGLEYGDSYNPPDDDGFSYVTLQYPFKFFNQTYNSLYVNDNGAISFGSGVSNYTPTCGSISIPMISPYWADVDTRYGGNISYRESLDRTLCAQATAEIVTAFPQYDGISIDWLFIATWNNTPFYGEIDQCNVTDPTLRNTFQAVLATDNVHSFTIFNYNGITWTTGKASGGDCAGLGGIPAKAGFDVGDNATFNEIPNSCTADIITIGDQTNTDTPGRFVFQINDEFKSTSCDPNADLKITSSFIRSYGNVPITIKGPCLIDANATTLQCNIHNLATGIIYHIPAVVVNNETAECITPYLHAQTPCTVSLSYRNNAGGLVITQTGTFYTVEIVPEFYIFVAGTNGTVFILMSWDPALFGGQSSTLLDLVLVQNIHFLWSEQAVVMSGIPNTGEKYGNANVTITNDTVPYVFRLTMSPVTGLNIYQTVPNYQPSAFSDMIYFGPVDQASNIALCQNFYDTYPTAPASGVPCPPLLSQAEQDPRFVVDFQPTSLHIFYPGAEAAYRQRFPLPGYSGHVCTYANGTILVGPTGGGTASYISPAQTWGQVGHFLYDVKPWYQCCYYAADDASCRKYYERRPSDDGTHYTPPSAGGSGGDPHLRTFDGLPYLLNRVGEYWMVKTPSGNFSMQGRMEQYIEANGTRANASVFTAFVMIQENTDNSTRVQVSVQPLVGFNIIVNDANINLAEDQVLPVTLVVTGLSLTIQSSSTIVVTFTLGFSFIFTTADQSTSINILSMASINQYGNVDGLLGHFDGTKVNDLKLRNGTTIPYNSSPQTIHSTFGLSWLITESESLFNYTVGRSYGDYQNPSFVPNFGIPDPASIPSNVQTMCGGNNECLFDYATTGSILLANDTNNWGKSYNSTVTILNQQVPMCTPVTPPSHGFVKTKNYLVGSNVTFGCDTSYVLHGYSKITCVQSGQNPPAWNHNVPTCNYCCLYCPLCLTWVAAVRLLPILTPLAPLTTPPCCPLSFYP